MQTKLKNAAFLGHSGRSVQHNSRNRLLDLIAVPLRVISIISILGLASCGGGGGGGDNSAAPSGLINQAPVLGAFEAPAVLEGSVNVGSVRATDANGDPLSYSIVSGDDQSLFVMTPSGDLSFDAAPDFEEPADADGDNEYLVTVQVTDGLLTDNQPLEISVTDAFEGRVVDGPIRDARVFIDTNGNNEQDEGEPSGETDENGYFSIPLPSTPAGSDAKIISIGGKDTVTGKALPDFLLIGKVPVNISDFAYVSALTTVLHWAEGVVETATALEVMGVEGEVEAKKTVAD